MIIDGNGLQIDTFDEILASVIEDFRVAMNWTPELTAKVQAGNNGTWAQLVRIIAEREAALQEVVLDVYDTLSWTTEETNLDRVVRLVGVTRTPALTGQVTGDVTGTAAHTITEGTQIEYGITGTVWEVAADVILDGSGDGEATLNSVDPGEARPVNVGYDFTGTLTGPVVPPPDTHRLTLTGFGLGAPVDIEAAPSGTFGFDSILRALASELEAQSEAGGDIEGVVTTTRVTGPPESATIQIWTSPALATGTIVYTYLGVLPVGIAPTMTIDPSLVWSPLGDADWDTFVALAQPIVGAPAEDDAQLRASAAVEAFRRGQGPQAAIRAAVSLVTGVTYVGVWESQVQDACDTDADGIPGRAINVVVDGGTDADVADAIYRSRGAGTYAFAFPGPTAVSVVVFPTDGPGSPVTIGFNRVAQIEIWMDVEITTSTVDPSQPPAPPDVETIVSDILLAAATELFEVGADVLPWRLEGAVFEADLPGIDDVRVELSFDDGVLDPYTRAKRVITLRQRAVADAARITVTQV